MMKLTSLVIFALLATAAGPTASQVIVIEAEDYADSLDIGGVPIGPQEGSGCSGGFILIGLDVPDEWVSYDVTVDTPGVYAPRLCCRGDYGVEYHMQLTFTPDSVGEAQTVDFHYTGTGYG
jgi:hypothetical protein